MWHDGLRHYFMEDDLNRLRRRQPEKPTKAIEKQIADLRAEIGELERHINDPGELTKFMALNPASQLEQLNRVNSALPPEHQYSMQDYIDELRQAEAEPSISELRLAAAKQKLDGLLGVIEGS
jgi:hypothetical protein